MQQGTGLYKRVQDRILDEYWTAASLPLCGEAVGGDPIPVQ